MITPVNLSSLKFLDRFVKFVSLILASLLFISLSLVSCTGAAVQNQPSVPSSPILMSPMPTPTSITNNPTAVPSSLPLPANDLPFSQSDEAIPVCNNIAQPASFDQLDKLQGLVFYTDPSQRQWFVLSGPHFQTEQVVLPAQEIDSYSFSKDKQWLLAYSHIPVGAPCFDCAPFSVWLVSEDGQVQAKTVDLTAMSTFIHQGAETYAFMSWDFEWVDSQMVKVSAGFGESSPHEYAFGYYDVFQGTWRNDLLENLPGRESDQWTYPYAWTDISPDQTRMFFLDVNFDLVLWDLEKHNELWRDSVGDHNFPISVLWTSNSQKVAFWTLDQYQDIQLLGRDGDGYMLLPKPVYPSENQGLVFAWYGSWSPNDELLAVSGNIQDAQTSLETPMIYVFDFEKNAYVYRCPAGSVGDQGYPQAFFWSPDGELLISKRRFKMETTPFRLYDLGNLKVYQHGQEQLSAVGWVNDFSLIWK